MFRPFVFDADDLALDLANTVHLHDGVPVDLLDGTTAVIDWLGAAGLLDGPGTEEALASPPMARLLFDETRRLRDVLPDLVDAAARRTVLPTEAVHVVNRVLEARSTRLSMHADGPVATLRQTVSCTYPLGALAPIAEAAARLVATCDPERLRRCDGADCSLWFYDTSRGGRRRWCSMARCGNRAKVAAHYHRTRAGA